MHDYLNPVRSLSKHKPYNSSLTEEHKTSSFSISNGIRNTNQCDPTKPPRSPRRDDRDRVKRVREESETLPRPNRNLSSRQRMETQNSSDRVQWSLDRTASP
ncbi:unnamed protein product [Microthlaspi erraticum]|uniref:Uncharacterized protein n=1 Tax=Microthlaspi erraticum TaxID=1685480 RepID=A0A6D2L6Z5_9BRAS|nr:unnamed protein product [Microthlaspi erraticum]